MNQQFAEKPKFDKEDLYKRFAKYKIVSHLIDHGFHPTLEGVEEMGADAPSVHLATQVPVTWKRGEDELVVLQAKSKHHVPRNSSEWKWGYFADKAKAFHSGKGHFSLKKVLSKLDKSKTSPATDETTQHSEEANTAQRSETPQHNETSQSNEASQHNENPDILQPPTDSVMKLKKLEAVLAGLAMKGIVLPSDFTFDSPMALDVLLAAVNSSLKTEMSLAQAAAAVTTDTSAENTQPENSSNSLPPPPSQNDGAKESPMPFTETLDVKPINSNVKKIIIESRLPPALKTRMLAIADSTQFDEKVFSLQDTITLMEKSLPSEFLVDVSKAKEAPAPKANKIVGRNGLGEPVMSNPSVEQFFEKDENVGATLHVDPEQAERIVSQSPLGAFMRPRGAYNVSPNGVNGAKLS